MLDLLIVTIFSVGLIGFLIGLVIVTVKHNAAIMSESIGRADELIAKAKQWREVAAVPVPVPVPAKPAIQPVP